MTLEEGVQAESSRVRVLRAILIVGMILDGVAVMSGMAQYALLSRASSSLGISEAEAASNDNRQAMIGFIRTFTFVTCAIVWLAWMHRAYSNLQLLGTGMTDYAPGWAVGCWFIPIMNLFRPLQLTKELWQRSEKRNSTDFIRDLGTPALLGFWWAALFVTGFLRQVLMDFSLKAESIAELKDVTMMGIGMDVLGAVSALLAISVIMRIDAFQRGSIEEPGEARFRPVPA